MFGVILLPGAGVLSNLVCPFEKLTSLIRQLMSPRSQVPCTFFQFPCMPLHFFASDKISKVWLCWGVFG